jgi:ribosome-associated protein
MRPPPEPMTSPQAEPSQVILAPPDVRVARLDVRFAATRSRGPGGQAVNKVSSAIQLRVPLDAIMGLSPSARQRLAALAGSRLTRRGTLVIGSDTHRSQVRNRQACLERLARLVRAAVREPTPRRPTRPSRAAVARRLEQKRRRGERKRMRKGEQ